MIRRTRLAEPECCSPGWQLALSPAPGLAGTVADQWLQKIRDKYLQETKEEGYANDGEENPIECLMISH